MRRVQQTPLPGKKSRFPAFFAIWMALGLTCGASLQAQTTWTGAGADDNWFNNNNWDTLLAPNGITTNVVIGSPSPTIANGTININSLTVGAGGILNQNNSTNFNFGGTAATTLINAGSISAGDNSDFQLSGLVNNSGSISANDGTAAGTSDLEVVAGGATLDGGGTISLAGGPAARIVGVSGAILNIANQTIQGAGEIGLNLVVNNSSNGLINANVNGQTLVFDTTGTSTNQGVMQASGGGVLAIDSSTINNTGGTIQALSGSVVEIRDGVTISGGTLTGAGVFNVSNSSNNFLDNLAFSGTMSAGDNADLGITGTILNSGSITMNDGTAAGFSDLEVQSGGATLDGGGTISLAGGPAARIVGVGGAILNIASQTIQGAGEIGLNLVVNNSSNGLINANVNGQTLVFDTTGTSTNQGVMQASGGGVLAIDSSTINNTGGTIQALAGSVVEIRDGVTISGGTLTGAGVFNVSNSSNNFLENLAFSGTMSAGDNADLGITGTILNSGSITMNDGTAAGFSDLEVQSGGATLDGGGTVSLAGGPAARIVGVGGAILNIANQTIQGAGEIGANSLTLNNLSSGTIHANLGGTTLTIDPSGASTTAWTNQGILRASNGGILNSVHDTTNNGTIDALSGSIVQTLSLDNNGILQGSGTVNITNGLVNDGAIGPGASPGTLTVNAANASFGATSQLLIEIDGAATGQFDLLDMNFGNSTGKLGLDGSLLVGLNGFLPGASDLFVVLTADNNNGSDGADLFGSFANVADGGTLTTNGGEGYFTVSYGSGANANRVLLSNFVVTIPEPGSVAMVVAGFLFATCLRRKRA